MKPSLSVVILAKPEGRRAGTQIRAFHPDHWGPDRYAFGMTNTEIRLRLASHKQGAGAAAAGESRQTAASKY